MSQRGVRVTGSEVDRLGPGQPPGLSTAGRVHDRDDAPVLRLLGPLAVTIAVLVVRLRRFRGDDAGRER